MNKNDIKNSADMFLYKAIVDLSDLKQVVMGVIVMIISKSFNSWLTEPNILNDLTPFEECYYYTIGKLK